MSAIRGSSGRTDLHMFDPQQLTIEVDPSSPYCDPSSAPPDAAMVASIKEFGVLEPVLCTRTKAGLIVIAGRRRVLAAREAGVDVPVRLIQESPERAAAIQVAENEMRRSRTELERAEYCARLMELEYSHEQVAVILGRPTSYVRALLAIRERGCDALKKAVNEGQVGVTAAAQLARQSEEDQLKALAEKKTPTPREPKEPKEPSPMKRPGTRAIKAWLMEHQDDLTPRETALLSWILTGGEAP